MLTEVEFEEWHERIGLSPAAVEIIQRVRHSEPSRRVGSGAGNVRGRYPSHKMSRTIQFESRTLEFSAVLEMEHDPDVVEFYDQPAPIVLRYKDSRGHLQVVTYTPDFLVLKSASAEWVEWKPEARVCELAERAPNRYVRDGERWRYPPAETYASERGLQFVLRTDNEINPIRVRNLLFLEDYATDESPVSEKSATALRRIVTDEPGISAYDLLSAATSLLAGEPAADADPARRLAPQPGGAIANDLYRMMLADELYIDLEHVLLDDPRHAPVFANATEAQIDRLRRQGRAAPTPNPLEIAPGARLEWDGRAYEVLNVGRTKVALQGEPLPSGAPALVEFDLAQLVGLVARGSVRPVGTSMPGLRSSAAERLRHAPKKARDAARDRFARIAPVIDGDAPVMSLSRNEQRWLCAYRREASMSGLGTVGLVPKPRPGNRTNHPVAVPDEAISQAIEAMYTKPWQMSIAGIQRRLNSQLHAEGVTALPSAGRVRRLIRRMTTSEREARRKGTRAAYGAKEFAWTLSASSPQHGVRPYERAHIDHTLCDIQLVDRQHPSLVLGRPWLTMAMDAHTRRVLGFFLSFDPPSHHSDLMVLRDCVRRNSRLPDSIVSDCGADFESVDYETFLALVGVTKLTRPPAQSRYGSPIERLFGITDELLTHQTIGNTQAAKRVRTLTPSVDPAALAAWDLESFNEALEEFFFEVYDRRMHPALGASPRDAYARGIAFSGSRPTRFWKYDDDFIRLTTSGHGESKATIGRHGLRVRGRRYWHDMFRDPRLRGVTVAFVADAWDTRHNNVFLYGVWTRCHEPAFVGLPPVSEREVAIASVELEARRKAIGRLSRASDIEIGDFLRDVDAHGELLAQRRKDQALRDVAARTGLSRVEETPAQPPQGSEESSIGNPQVSNPGPIRVVDLEEYH